MINVLVVDDCATDRELLSRILRHDPEINVACRASSGREALDLLQSNKVQVVTMDLNLPDMDGLHVARRIMESHPVPIVIVTNDHGRTRDAFKLMEAGAVAALQKPPGPGHPEHEVCVKNLLRTIKGLNGVKLVRRTPRSFNPGWDASKLGDGRRVQCIGIGASTGGPPVISKILQELPTGLPPILITQHMANGFMGGFVSWLDEVSPIPVLIAQAGQRIESGVAYVAPDDMHMGVNAAGEIILNSGPPENGLRPSVAFLFRSMGTAFGANCVAVLLTGMGRDGAAEMKGLFDRRALTIAQDKETSLIHGMPGEAIALGGAKEILPLDLIAKRLLSYAQITPTVRNEGQSWIQQ